MFFPRLRKLRSDMIEVFKMIHCMNKVNLEKLFCLDKDERIRKVFLKIRSHINSNIQLKIFIRRVNYWNHLTDEVVSCKSSSTFKIKLNEFTTPKREI